MRLLALTLSVLTMAAVAPAQDTPALSGTWTARLQGTRTGHEGDRRVSLQLQYGDRHQIGMPIPASLLEGLNPADDRWTARDVRFTLRRDAGTVVFEGSFVDGRGAGTFAFTPSAEYARAMQPKHGTLGGDELFRLAMLDVSREFIQSIEREGYPDLALDDLVSLRVHGIDASYVRDFRAAGYDRVPVDDLVRTRIHGATPRYVREMRELGYGELSGKQLVRFRIHGVSADFIRELREAGYRNLSAEDLVNARIHGRRWLTRR